MNKLFFKIVGKTRSSGWIKALTALEIVNEYTYLICQSLLFRMSAWRISYCCWSKLKQDRPVELKPGLHLNDSMEIRIWSVKAYDSGCRLGKFLTVADQHWNEIVRSNWSEDFVRTVLTWFVKAHDSGMSAWRISNCCWSKLKRNCPVELNRDFSRTNQWFLESVVMTNQF